MQFLHLAIISRIPRRGNARTTDHPLETMVVAVPRLEHVMCERHTLTLEVKFNP
jgi:hypothetical protein